MSCCNPTGGAGKGLDRDIVNEHFVRNAKTVFKGLHSQLTDTVVTKAVLGDNLISLIEAQDTDSMLLGQGGGRTSQQYITDEQKLKIREELERVDPFSSNRMQISYFDKISGSAFSGLSKKRLVWFLERNKSNFRKGYPHKNLT